MTSRGRCRNPADEFCYVCGVHNKKSTNKRKIDLTSKYAEAYKKYFSCDIHQSPMCDQDKSFAPHFICNGCRHSLTRWMDGKGPGPAFCMPRIWTEPQNHTDDCYFCSFDTSKYENRHIFKNLKVFDYPDLSSSRRPVPHGDTRHPFLQINSNAPPDSTSPVKRQKLGSTSSSGEEFSPPLPSSSSADDTPPFRPFTQAMLNDFVRELELTKDKSELCASRLKEFGLLDKDCNVTSYRKRHESFSPYFRVSDNDALVYCHDIPGLFTAMGLEHKSSEWRLFLDSSKYSMKAVLLHNGNKYPSIPVGYSIQMQKESYDNVKYMLDHIRYNEHNWDVIGDCKMICFLTGMQQGYTKYSCFMCMWDSRDDSNHYTKKVWPARDETVLGKHNMKHPALVPNDKILLGPLHLKLGYGKQLIKCLFKHDSPAYWVIRAMFPAISDAKVSGGIFTGPQIRKMMKLSKKIEDVMSPTEKAAWLAFQGIVTGFLGNHKASDWEERIQNFLKTYQVAGCRMSIKMHYLDSHQDFFRENLGDVSEEHGERFHQDCKDMEKRYMRRCDEVMMGDYIWGLMRDTDEKHKRKSRTKVI
jgi:hypothetical protein